MFEKLFSGNGRNKKLQGSALEVSQMLEKAKSDEFEGTRLSKALTLLGKAREKCEEPGLEDIIQEAGDLVAEALENMQKRIKKRQLECEKIKAKLE